MYISRIESELGALPRLLGEDGVAFVPNIYPPGELAEINAAMDPFFARKAGEARSYIWPDDMLALGIFEKVLSPAMRDVLFSIMPDPVIYHMLSSEIAGSSTRSHVFAEQPGGWHRDPDCSYYAHDPTHVSVTVYLTDVGPADGTFEIATQLPDLPLHADTPIVSVTGDAGQSTVWHRSFYHRAAPNSGPRRRRIIKFSVQRNQFPSGHLKNHFFRRTLSEVPAGDPRMDLLLGRYQGKSAPDLPTQRFVTPARVPPTTVLGPVANEHKARTAGKRTYTVRDASDLGPLPHLLAKDGIARLPDLFSIRELAELNAALNPFFKAKAKEARAYAWSDDLLKLGVLQKILSPVVKNALYSMLPDPVIHHLLVSEIAGGSSKPPLYADQPGGWRRDTDAGYYENDPTHISLLVYLSEVALDDGALEVSPQLPDQKLRADSLVISMAGSAGLSFAMNRGFYYRERPNTGPRRRRLLKISVQRNFFVSAGLKQPHFAKTLADTAAGDAKTDILLGRMQNGKAPAVLPDSEVFPLRVPVSGRIGDLI